MLLAYWYHPILATLFGFLALILMAVILLQRGRGVGLSGAFGGAGGHTAFGSKTGDVLTWATIVIAGMFLFYTVVLNYLFVPPRAPGAAPPPAAPAPAPTTSESGETSRLPAEANPRPAEMPHGVFDGEWYG
ncbi:MAG: preprotein translocase subunit SecG [Phycisphaerae bacterium]|jgi:preprotein translocase subunit SecG